jgi:hypothetical protein
MTEDSSSTQYFQNAEQYSVKYREDAYVALFNLSHYCTA